MYSQDFLEKFVSTILFGRSTEAYRVDSNNPWGHAIFVYKEFSIEFEKRIFSYEKIIKILRQVGFEKCGDHFQSYRFWQPYQVKGNGMPLLTNGQMAHIYFAPKFKEPEQP